MTLASSSILDGRGDSKYACGARTGTRTAGDFTITLGFTPSKVRVVNLTDRVDATYWVGAALDGGSNAKGLLQIADGTTTYADVGITVGDRDFTVDVSVVGLETDNDDVLWEAWAEGQG